MAKQDEWIRITLRIPPELHQRLVEAAATNSMNAEIIARLEASFGGPSREAVTDTRDAVDQLVAALIRDGWKPPMPEK